jgi:HNH endonuclease
VLDAEARNRDPDDHRTPAQRRLDAMTEICRQFLDRTDRPTVAGERPHVSLTVSVEALRGSGTLTGPDADAGSPGTDAGSTVLPAGLTSPDPARYADVFAGIDPDRMCELDQTGPVSPAVARRISCDASVMRIVMAGQSEPLDVGRRTPVIPPSMRRAVVLRDRHCRFPGCYRPAAWCDAHHIVHWADGGPTAVANLLLLCRRHHRTIHDGRFRLTLEDGRPMFRRPDGSVLEENRAPP